MECSPGFHKSKYTNKCVKTRCMKGTRKTPTGCKATITESIMNKELLDTINRIKKNPKFAQKVRTALIKHKNSIFVIPRKYEV